VQVLSSAFPSSNSTQLLARPYGQKIYPFLFTFS
jgi:hypothetical protein